MASRGTAPERSNTGPEAPKPMIVDSRPSMLGAAIQDEIDAVAEIGGDMLGGCGAHPAGNVGARRCDRDTRRFDQRARDRVRGHAQRHRRQTGADEVGERRIRPARQDEGQRTRPEYLRYSARIPREFRIGFRLRNVAYMHNQRVETRPTLRLEDLRHGFAAPSIRAEAVHGLSRKGHKAARTDDMSRAFQHIGRKLCDICHFTQVAGHC